MPYFTHIRKKPYFAVVEVGGKLYVDGQGYNPDTLKPIAGAELDVFAPTSTASFFDFGAPVIGLARSSYICKTSQLSSVNSGKVKVFDSSVVLTGQNIGTVGIGTDSSNSLFVATKKDPSGTDQKNDRLFSLSSSMEYLQNKSPISIQTGAENKAYRLNTVFWNQTTGSTRLMAINSETLVRGNTTSNNVAAFTTSDLSTYQAVQSDLLEMNQLVYLDASKTNSTSSYAVVNRSQIASSSTKSPQTVMFDTATGARYVPPAEKVDLGLSSYWVTIVGDVAANLSAPAIEGRSIAVDSEGTSYVSSSNGTLVLSPNGTVSTQTSYTYSNDKPDIVVAPSGGAIQVKVVSIDSPRMYYSKISKSGDVEWQTSSTGISNSGWCVDAHIDASGNLYAGSGTLRFGYEYDGFFEKRSSSNGALIWRASAGQCCYAVTSDASGNVYFSGKDEIESTYHSAYACLEKRDATGHVLWLVKQKRTTAVAASNSMCFTGLCVDKNGYVYAVGESDIGTAKKAVLYKYDDSGGLVWSKLISHSHSGAWLVSQSTLVPKVAQDSSGNIYVVFTTSSGVRSGVLAKMDSSGNLLWAQTITAAGGVDLNQISIDSLGGLYLVGNATFVVGERSVVLVMKVPPDGSGTGSFAFTRGAVTCSVASLSVSSHSSIRSTDTRSDNLSYTTGPAYSDLVTATSYSSSRSAITTAFDPLPDCYVGCFASNATWASFYEGSGPVYFTGNCQYSGTLGLDFVRVRYISETAPTCKRVWVTINNPSSLSLAVPTDMDYRNIRPFLFKNDSDQLMLGVFAYYNGTSSASNVASLMVFSVGTTTQADSIELTYLQRIDLSGGGTDFITSVTPVDDTQRAWLINYGDKAKVYTFSQASNFTLTNTYTWGRSGQVDSYGIDSRGRLWYTTGDVLSYIPLRTDPATVNTGLKAYFDDSSYAYSGTTVNSNLYVSSYAIDGLREQRSVTVTLEGGAIQFSDGTTTKTVTTSASNDLAVPIRIVGSGIFSAKLS